MYEFSLRTPRLVLRPFRESDAADIQPLLEKWDVARMTGRIPHPYPADGAPRWIAAQARKRAAGMDYVFAPEFAGQVVGAIGLYRGTALTDGATVPTMELGYWIGVPYWGRGLATEGVQAVIDFAFEWLGMARMVASRFADNPAS